MSFPWAKQYEPSNGLTKFLDEKLPVPRLVYNAVGAGYPVPRNLNYMWNFGVLAGFFLVLQIVTGVVLAMHYAANASVAFATTEHIMRDINWGWLMRYAHANGASFFFVVVYIHIFRGFYYSSYKAPREMIWLLGVTIFLLMMAPYIDKNPSKKPEDRKFAVSLMTVHLMFWAVLVMIGSFFRGPGFNFIFPWNSGLFFEL